MKSSTERFTECWHTDGPRVLAYARRHIGDDQAQEVVADTFLVAWRKWDSVPDPAIAWLIATARGVIRNRRRSLTRRRALESRMGFFAQAVTRDQSEFALTRQEALRRLGELNGAHREALLLTSWDGLSTDEAARVVGISPAAFRKRLSRARACLADDPSPPALRGACLFRVTSSKELP